MVRWASEPVDRQTVPTGSEAHRTKPRVMPASGIVVISLRKMSLEQYPHRMVKA